MLKYFNIESTKIACWINSNNFGTHKQSLIFIHGSGSDHSVWSHQYAQLRKQYNIVAIDLPGHGRSEGSGEDEVGNYCLWVRKLMDVLNLKNPILVGHSLGAAITLSFALNYPGAISAIIVVSGGIRMPVSPFLLEGIKQNPAATIDLICKLSLAKENRLKFFASLKKSFSQTNADILYGDFLACSKLDLTEKINKINLSALVLCGVEDKMTPPDFSRQIAGGIGGAKLSLIEGAGHMVMVEKPKEFNEALNKFALSISQGG